jgi:hypothetical protein
MAMAEKSFVNESGEMFVPPPAPPAVVAAPPALVVAPAAVVVAPAAAVVAAALVADDDLFELSLPQATRPAAVATASDAKHARRMERCIVITSLFA